MKLSPPRLFFLSHGALALLLAAGAAVQVRAEERILKFSDPSKPGKVVIHMGLGDLQIEGADVTEVTVLSEEDFGGGEELRDDGLRRLDSGGDNHAVSTSGNTITIACNAMFGGRHGGHGGSSDLALTVPKGTYLVVNRSGPGDTVVEGLAGDIEMRAAVGDVELSDISGGVVVEAAHGDVSATFATFPADRPVSISTAHGDVEVHVPEEARAKVRFRTLRGEILTDFSKEQLVTKMDQSETFMVESVDVDVDVKVDVKTDLKREKERARAEIERAREEERQAQRAAREAAEQDRRAAAAASGGVAGVPPVPPVPPLPPMPAMPAMPAMAGGKVVTGQLNGGGVDLTITALMGDITFRKAD